MLIDVHAHYSPQRYTNLLATRGGRYQPVGGPHNKTGIPQYRTDSPEDIAGRIRLMDEAGVDMQVLSHAVASPYSHNEAEAVEAAQVCNDTYNDLVKLHPDRFAAFCGLPLPHVQASLRELGRALDDLGMVGVTMTCSALNQSVTRPELAPIYEEMNRRGSALFIHPSGGGLASSLITEYRLNFACGAPMEDTQVVAHLIADQIPVRYPNVKIIASHFGGAIPVLLHRLDNEMPYPDLAEPPSQMARRLYYDTVGHGSQIALYAGWKAFGADHLIAGSDYPILIGFEPYNDTFEYIRQSGLPPEDIEKILHQNAGRVLGIPERARA